MPRVSAFQRFTVLRCHPPLPGLQPKRPGEAIAASLAVELPADLGSENFETNPKAKRQTPFEINASTPCAMFPGPPNSLKAELQHLAMPKQKALVGAGTPRFRGWLRTVR
jgi:hypothetical protein